VSAANKWDTKLNTSKGNFISASSHVLFCLFYEHTYNNVKSCANATQSFPKKFPKITDKFKYSKKMISNITSSISWQWSYHNFTYVQLRLSSELEVLVKHCSLCNKILRLQFLSLHFIFSSLTSSFRPQCKNLKSHQSRRSLVVREQKIWNNIELENNSSK